MSGLVAGGQWSWQPRGPASLPAMFGPALVTPVRPPSRGVHNLGAGLAAAKKLELCGADRYSSATMQRRRAASVFGFFLRAQLGTKGATMNNVYKHIWFKPPTDLHETKHARHS